MMPHDIDLDIHCLLEQIPEDHVAFYMRASAGNEKDFVYAGDPDLEDMAEALINIMKQSEQIA
jgi:hypothetical protein